MESNVTEVLHFSFPVVDSFDSFSFRGGEKSGLPIMGQRVSGEQAPTRVGARRGREGEATAITVDARKLYFSLTVITLLFMF